MPDATFAAQHHPRPTTDHSRPTTDHPRPTTARTLVAADAVDFRLPQVEGLLGVRLEIDWSLGATDPEFVLSGDFWNLHVPRPAVDRMEYQFTLRFEDRTEWITDPGNPATVPNPFGEKSEICFPGYEPPRWLSTPAVGALETVETDRGALDSAVPVTIWSPPGLDPATPAPLLVANDGSDLAARGSLLTWASMAVRNRTFRIALLDPAVGHRDNWYSANDSYADHVARILLPAVESRVAVGARIGLGVSLGALSMLTIQRRHPQLLQGLLLQSGSFFTCDLDPQESGYGSFRHICDAVESIAANPAERGAPVLITCGGLEENRSNNEQMARTLAGQGYRVDMHLVPDAHTMIGWRDAWSPGLEHLLEIM